MPTVFKYSVPQRLLLLTGLHVGLGCVLWAISGGWSELFGYYFQYLGPAFLVSFAFLELAFSLRVQRAFQPGEELRRAWTLMAVGAAFRLLGVFMAHAWHPSDQVRNIGLFLSGPVQLAFACGGLTIVLRLYRRLGYSVKLSSWDWVLVTGCALLAVSGIVQNLITPSSGFLTDTLLCVLIFQAILLKRSVSQMGGGLVAACWTSYVYAVFLTALGDLGITFEVYALTPAHLLPAGWLIWYVAAAAWSLGPAFLSEAVYMAQQSASMRYGSVSRMPKTSTASFYR